MTEPAPPTDDMLINTLDTYPPDAPPFQQDTNIVGAEKSSNVFFDQ